MAGILSALSQVSNILYEANENGLTGKALVKALESKDLKLMKADGSMLKLLNNYIVEPVAVISSSLKEDEIIDKVLGLHTDMFTGFYMQAYNILTTVYNKDTSIAIDVLGTDNSGLETVLMRGLNMSVEDLDNKDFLGELLTDNFTLATEAKPNLGKMLGKAFGTVPAKKTIKEDGGGTNDNNKDKPNSKEEEPSSKEEKTKSGNKNNINVGTHSGFKDLYIPNAIQRTIEVTIVTTATNSEGKKGINPLTITIPVTIKTHVIYTGVDTIINALNPNSDDKGFFNRVDEYRAGAISLADLVFTGDIIKQYKDNKIKDKDKLLDLIQARKLSANSKMANKDAPFAGFEKYYNMYIISADDKVYIEKHLKGKLSKGAYKQKFLDQAYGLSVTVMDQDYERVQIMLRDIRGTTDLTYKTVSKTDKNGTDTGELVKALLANKPPVF